VLFGNAGWHCRSTSERRSAGDAPKLVSGAARRNCRGASYRRVAARAVCRAAGRCLSKNGQKTCSLTRAISKRCRCVWPRQWCDPVEARPIVRIIDRRW